MGGPPATPNGNGAHQKSLKVSHSPQLTVCYSLFRKTREVSKMATPVGDKRLYETLCKVLDSLRSEAPTSISIYHPPAGNVDGLIQARSRAFLHLFLKARFGMIDFAEREELVTDGKHDGGIDAYYIDKKNKRTYILQPKFRATSANFTTTNMTPSDLLKMDVKRIMKGEKCDEDGTPYNGKIHGMQKAVQKVTDIGGYSTHVVLLGNTKNLSSSQLHKLIDGYTPDQVSHDRAYQELVFPVINGTYFVEPSLTIEINLENLKGATHLDYEVKAASLKSNVKLLFVPTSEIGRIMHQYRNSVLKFNPRSFLELQKNPVNQEIETSVKKIKSNEFALFNNGITIIADQTSVSSDTAKQGSAQVVLTNPQLVNGAQTAYTLARIYENCLKHNDFKVFKGKEVLLKVITFVGPQKPSNTDARLRLIADISKASNSQTKVEESDRRSNDPVQIKLQQELFNEFGLYYERKLGEFSDGLRYGYVPVNLLVKREKLVRVALACDYRTNQTRSSTKKFFDQAALASLLKISEAAKYAYGYQVLELLELRRKVKPKTKGDRYHTKEFGQALRYGQYAVVTACANLGPPASKTEAQIVDSILGQWQNFEAWAAKQPSNKPYTTGSAFDFDNYYKGSTINSDLKNYTFTS